MDVNTENATGSGLLLYVRVNNYHLCTVDWNLRRICESHPTSAGNLWQAETIAVRVAIQFFFNHRRCRPLRIT